MRSSCALAWLRVAHQAAATAREDGRSGLADGWGQPDRAALRRLVVILATLGGA